MGHSVVKMRTYRVPLILTVCLIHNFPGLFGTGNLGHSENIESRYDSSSYDILESKEDKPGEKQIMRNERNAKIERKLLGRDRPKRQQKTKTAKQKVKKITKIKLNTKRYRNMLNSKKQRLTDPRQSCGGSTPVPLSCMENAASVLLYEKNQVTNYLKQSKQLIKHKNTTDNKLFKKGEFKDSADHMLIAVGGNLSNPTCGDNSTDNSARNKQQRSLDLHMDYYYRLINCSAAIHEACDVPDNLHNETSLEKIKECNTTMEEFKKLTKTCQTEEMKKNATMQCDCWAGAKQAMKEIQALKCETNKAKKEVTANKRKCSKVFSNCKKMEDFSVFLIYTCMNDHSLHLINQTAKSLHNGAMKDAFKALAGADEVAKQVIEGRDLDMEKHFDHDPYNDLD